MQNENPLVSIIVVTYNSSKYVLETLKSAKSQTYRNIELIVSDDCSVDHTVELCRHWLEENKERFIRTEIIAVEKNTGIAPNCNRGLRSARGEWIKLIAGDDILLPNCLSDNVNHAINYPSISFLFSNIQVFSQKDQKIVPNVDIPPKSFFQFPSKKQKRKLISYNHIMAPTSFLNREKLLSLEGFDERFRNIEDYPLWIKATSKGFRLYFMDIPTVIYRLHEASISMGMKNEVRFKDDLFKLLYLYKIPNMSILNIFDIWDNILYIGSLYSKHLKFLQVFSPLYLFRVIRNFLLSFK